jgi:hypothetical protein
MGNRARVERSAMGRLLLLLLLAVGLMHLLVHAASAPAGGEAGATAHVHAVQSEAAAWDGETPQPAVLTSPEVDHDDAEGAADLGLCMGVAVAGCCALLTVGTRRLSGRRAAERFRMVRRRPPHAADLRQCARPDHALGISQLAVLRI